MADTKITALTALTGADPANDVIPIVDVSDTTMAASGTTKKISVNNILGASGTATLASATITGDLTVDTSTLKVDSVNNRVGINNASPAQALDVDGNIIVSGVAAGNRYILTNGDSNYTGTLTLQAGRGSGTFGGALTLFGNSHATYPGGVWVGRSDGAAGPIIFGNGGISQSVINYRITGGTGAGSGIHTWEYVGGVAGNAMTLNSTGLGVGGSPTRKLSIVGSGATYANINSGDNTSLVGLLLGGTSAPSAGQLIYDNTANSLAFFTSGGNRMTLDASGRMLLGRTSPISSETFSSNGFALIGGATHQALIGEASGNVFAGSFTNTPFRVRTNNVEVAQFDASGNFLSYLTSTAPTLSTNGAMVFNLTSNTNLRISVRGTDGVTRTANITLA